MADETKRHRPTLGRAGTTTAYRKGCRCPRCTRANTDAKRRTRERAAQRGSRPLLSLVDDTTPHPKPEGTPADTHKPRFVGPMETAVTQDLAQIPSRDGIAYNTLKGAALALAREIDDTEGRGSKAPLVKQLVDVMSTLMGKEGAGDSLDELFASFAVPLAQPSAGNQAQPG